MSKAITTRKQYGGVITLPPIAPIISTTYVAPRPDDEARVIARNVTSGLRITVSWDDALDAPQNHFAAARALLDTHRYWGEQWEVATMCGTDGGYMFSTRLAE
jgi:hypothetical protein